MSQPILVFRMVERRKRGPFPIQGMSGGKTYAHANYEDAYGGHVFRLTAEQAETWGPDLAAATHRPLCNFYLQKVILPAPVGAVEDDGLNELRFKELSKIARVEGVPRYALNATVREMKAAIREHRAKPHETSPAQDLAGDSAPPESVAETATA